MPIGPALTEQDKTAIRNKLLAACENSWTVNGYKKTSIKSLCTEVNISIGTFYGLYPTKEDLFVDTILNIQNRLNTNIMDTIRSNPTKEGYIDALKQMFREYLNKPFLYNVTAPDFQSFITKLPPAELNKLQFDSRAFFLEAIDLANLHFQVDESLALGVINAILLAIQGNETLAHTCEPIVVFDFMADHLVDALFK